MQEDSLARQNEFLEVPFIHGKLESLHTLPLERIALMDVQQGWLQPPHEWRKKWMGGQRRNSDQKKTKDLPETA